MKNSFKFFNNRECKYFPCHEVNDTEKFNCLFCYCPLYLLEECGGNYQMYKGVKDCSSCSIPHCPKGYDYVNEKLKVVIEARKAAYFEEHPEEKEDQQ